MRLTIRPGRTLTGSAAVPGDKSIAHRWLILGATARGRSKIRDLPPSLDVRSTATALAFVCPLARPALEGWALASPPRGEGGGFTWDEGGGTGSEHGLVLKGEGRAGLHESTAPLDCGNSGTSIRLLAGLLAAAPFRTVLTGDESLLRRPMERVAEPLRRMGAEVRTTEGHAPVEVVGARLRGVRHRTLLPSAQVKSAILFAGLAAEGVTEVEEPAPTRDHTERALGALGAPVAVERGRVRISAFQHEGFEARVPGDVSSAFFLVAAAALTRSELEVRNVGLNPTRTHALEVMRRMGVPVSTRLRGEELGEPVGDILVEPGGELRGTEVTAEELPLVIDEVPVLAALAAHARGETWFVGATELRAKESDRLRGTAEGIRGLGGHAGDEVDDLVVAGGGLAGGTAEAHRDHRLAMALAVAALAAKRPCEIRGIEWADVSYPGFAAALRRFGADAEISP